MSKADPNYAPLLLCVDPDEEPWSARELLSLARGMAAWEWADPHRRKHLPSLVEFTGDEHSCDVIVRWEDDMGMTDVEVEDKTAGDVTRPVPILGSVDKDLTGQEKVILRLSRKIFTEVDATNWSRAAQHEIGHCLGLRHSHKGIMVSGIGINPAFITQSNREDAAAFRKIGTVGVDSLEGN